MSLDGDVQSSIVTKAQKRLTLRVTLDDVVPSIGPVVHLCAVCRDKARAFLKLSCHDGIESRRMVL
eukprot:3615686-Amphidinium_carterae.1